MTRSIASDRVLPRAALWLAVLLLIPTLMLVFKDGSASAAAGGLDPTFGSAGKVTTDTGPGNDDEGNDAALQSNGGIIVSGNTGPAGSPNSALLTIRYSSTGTVDAGFGFVTTTMPSASVQGNAVVVQGDQKIVVAGSVSNSAGGTDMLVVRYTASGQIDTSFGGSSIFAAGDGIATVNFPGLTATANDVAVDSGGNVYLAGAVTNGTTSSIALARLTSSGQLDTTFNLSGMKKFDWPTGQSAYANAIALEAGALGPKTIVAGAAANGGATGQDWAFARFNNDGSLDSGFGTSGVQSIDFGQSFGEQADAVQVASGPSILASGTGRNDFALAKLNDAGQPDPSFNGVGKVTTTVSSNLDEAQDFVVQADGKIIAGGYTVTGTVLNKDMAFVRYNADGSKDTTFGSGGISLVSFGANNDVANAVLAPDANSVIGAGTAKVATDDFALAKLSTVSPAASPSPSPTSTASPSPSPASTASPSPSPSTSPGPAPFLNPTDVAVTRQEHAGDGPTWFRADSQVDGGGNVLRFNMGIAGDVTVYGDWNGDGTKTPGVFRPSAGRWFLSNSATGANAFSVQFATPSDIPVIGDWDRDGIDTVGVFRPSIGRWFIASSNTDGGGSVINFQFGLSSDVPVVGDWNADGFDDPGLFRQSTGQWFLGFDTVDGGGGVFSFHFGTSEDSPVVGDWDGDGFDDPAVFRPRQGRWFLGSDSAEGGGTVRAFNFGIPADRPLAWQTL